MSTPHSRAPEGKADVLLDAQSRFQRMVIAGDPLETVMAAIIAFVEAESERALCSVLMLDSGSNRLHWGAAPSLPQSFRDAIDGLRIGPEQGSCGTAAYRGEMVVVSDIASDPLWRASREHALSAGLKASTSVPMKDSQGKVLGTLAFLYREAVAPSSYELLLIEIARDLTAIAIECHSREDERLRLLEAERASRAEAERLNRMKDEFLLTLSHELRTPLHAIIGWAHVLKQPRLEQGTLMRAIDKISKNVMTESQLIDDLLDVSQIATGNFRLDEGLVNIRQVVESALETARLAAEEKNLKISLRQDGGEALVRGDAKRLQQVAWNLLANAVKFTPDGGSIDVEISRHEHGIALVVRDSGVGIDNEFLPHVFDRFTQSDRSVKRVYGGLGLGLTIVKHLVELHGGTIKAESEGKEQGATFTVHLPSAIDHARAVMGLVPENIRPLPRLDGLHVMVVEDDDDSRQFIALLLQDAGAQVQAYHSALKALPDLVTRAPDLLVADIAMPDMDGIAFIERVRALEKATSRPRVPAIAVTAFAGEDNRLKVTTAGFDAHFSKPVAIPDLILAARDAVTRRASSSETRPNLN